MGLSDFKIKIFLILSRKQVFLIFPEMQPCTFYTQARKIKKIYHEKNPYILGNGNSLNFHERKLFLYFGKRKPQKILYIPGNGTFLYFRSLSKRNICDKGNLFLLT